MKTTFKAQGMQTGEMIIVAVYFLAVISYSWLFASFFYWIFIVVPALTAISTYYRTSYVVQDDGTLVVRSFFTPVRKRAAGIYKISYNPDAKGWNWRNRRMIVYYERGKSRGFFPVLPRDAEGLIAALKEKNPHIQVDGPHIPVNK